MSYKEVYTIIEPEAGSEKKSRWVKIGIAWVNKDGSLNVHLDAFPKNAKLHIRDKREKPESQPGQPPAWDDGNPF